MPRLVGNFVSGLHGRQRVIHRLGNSSLAAVPGSSIVHMFESVDVLGEAVAAHQALGRLAASIDSTLPGPAADELLAELVEVGRQADLAVCRAIERAERSGQFAVDGAGSVHQYVCRKVNERREWASKRIAAGRALADRLPMTAKTWEAGRLGLEQPPRVLGASLPLHPADRRGSHQ